LLARGAVDAGVGHGAFPLGQEVVLRGQTRKAPARDGIVLHILHPRLDLALVPGHFRFRGQDRRAVVPGKILQFGVQFGVEPVGLNHPSLQVVDHHRGRHPAEMPEGIFQRADKSLGGLPPHRFAVAFARMAQHAAQHVRPSPPVPLDHPRPAPEIHLQLLARRALQAPKRQFVLAMRPHHKPAHRMITARELVLGHQVLVDPLHRQARLPRRRDLLTPRFTLAAWTGRRAGVRVGG
jgi:hypothetical protein